MNQEIKQKWVAALNSGEYEQGQFALTQHGSFCCLGVLCDLYIKDQNNPNIQWETLHPELETKSLFTESGVLPIEVQIWADLRTANPEISIPNDDAPGGVLKASLSDVNDNGEPFSVIAKLIEEQL